MVATKKPIWRYGLFQIPTIFLAAFLLATGIVYLLSLGCRNFWIALFLGLSWIALMWVLIMPLDLLLRSTLKFSMPFAGKLSILHAIFWTVLTSVILASTLPAIWSQCAASELISLDWAQWRADIWNEMFLNQSNPAPIGSQAEFSFTVNRKGEISDINIVTSESDLETYVRERIENLEGSEILDFVPNTRRDEITYESSINVCEADEPGCGEPADPDSYPDEESFYQ